MSVRGVHSHLHHAYTKLGIGHRGELAALLGRGGGVAHAGDPGATGGPVR